MKAQRRKGRDTRLANSFWRRGGLGRRVVGRWVPGGEEGGGCWGMERSRIIIIIIIITRGKELGQSLIVGMKMSVRICLAAFGVRRW